MYKYKEIDSQMYLDTKNGTVFFNTNEVLRRINDGEPYIRYQNSLNFSQLKLFLDKKKLPVKELPTNQIDFAYYENDGVVDRHASSLDTVEVIDAITFSKLIKYIEGAPATRTKKAKREFKIIDWGRLKKLDGKDFDLFYSIQRTLRDIEGYPSTSHKSEPHTELSQQTLANQIASTLKRKSDKDFKEITVKPEQIDFTGQHMHANTIEKYVNDALYLELLHHYDFDRNERTKGKIQKLEEARLSTDTIRKLVKPFKSDELNGNYILTENYINTLDKMVERRINTVIQTAEKKFNNYEEDVHRLKKENSKTYYIIGSLKKLLPESQWRIFERYLYKSDIQSNMEIVELLRELIA
jgi:hypothetical protein